MISVMVLRVVYGICFYPLLHDVIIELLRAGDTRPCRIQNTQHTFRSNILSPQVPSDDR